MSAAAEASAKQVIHPNVKGSRRALLDTIATLIPEGETMTRPIDDDELAAQSGYRESSIYRARKFLVAHRLIRVIGGQGKVASYALSSMDAPALPLIGVAKPVRSRVIETPLLDVPLVEVLEAPIRSDTVGQNDGGWRSYFRHFDGGWLRYFRHFRHLRHFDGSWWRFWAYTVGQNDGSARMDVGVDVSRARDHVQQLQTRTTTAAPPRSDDRPRPTLRCRWEGTVHAWCQFRMHVPMTLHREELRHLARAATETAADLEARQFAIYAEEAAATPDDVPILDPNELTFWKRVLQARRRREFERAPPRRASRPPDIVGGTVCPHTPRCDRTTTCIERMVAEGRAAREQKSG